MGQIISSWLQITGLPDFTGISDASGYYTTSQTDTLLAAKANTASLGTAAFVNTGSTSGTIPVLTTGGVLPTSMLPGKAISAFLGEVASQAAMLALTGETGDWCIRTDDGPSSWIAIADDLTQLANWKRISTPTDLVLSVNGQVGPVVLSASDVGAYSSGDVDVILEQYLQSANNLSDVANLAIALGNLGGMPIAGGTFTGLVVFDAASGASFPDNMDIEVGVDVRFRRTGDTIMVIGDSGGIPTVTIDHLFTDTQDPADNSTRVATTAYADAAAAAVDATAAASLLAVLPTWVAGKLWGGWMMSTGSSSGAVTGSKIYAVRFFYPGNVPIQKLATSQSVAGAGGTVHRLMFFSETNGLPDTLLFSTAAESASAGTGVRSYAPTGGAQTPPRGWYWVGMSTTSAAAYWRYGASEPQITGVSPLNSTAAAVEKVYTRTAAYDPNNTPPANFGAGSWVTPHTLNTAWVGIET